MWQSEYTGAMSGIETDSNSPYMELKLRFNLFHTDSKHFEPNILKVASVL